MAGCSLDNARASQRGAYAKLHTQRDLPSRLPYQTQIYTFPPPLPPRRPPRQFRLGSESADVWTQIANIRLLPKVPESEFELRLNYIPILVV